MVLEIGGGGQPGVVNLNDFIVDVDGAVPAFIESRRVYWEGAKEGDPLFSRRLLLRELGSFNRFVGFTLAHRVRSTGRTGRLVETARQEQLHDPAVHSRAVRDCATGLDNRTQGTCPARMVRRAHHERAQSSTTVLSARPRIKCGESSELVEGRERTDGFRLYPTRMTASITCIPFTSCCSAYAPSGAAPATSRSDSVSCRT